MAGANRKVLVVFTLATAVQFIMGIVFIVLVRDDCERIFTADITPES